ncbi:hypothetical protein Bpfe_010267 [Biomphalaria pfeifferi]|uniref:Uncharacterized protein n=1 Tax=Biomphalaria pfeifferi TaxID=112525 RepID=A0AAD8BTN0_BIOPF|nr:hypothetical protein Bpfe_010267 [Biomphalaria pfeifferi]
MAYLDAVNLHTLPAINSTRPPGPEPSSILFCQGPQWTWRYQRNRSLDKLDDRFMYKDQGPPMYRLLGAHYGMYPIPNKTDFHTYARSYHYETRGSTTPDVSNGALTFPPGPPPPQVAMFDGLTTSPTKSLSPDKGDMAYSRVDTLLVWDKYRYLPGPPPEAQMYQV